MPETEQNESIKVNDRVFVHYENQWGIVLSVNQRTDAAIVILSESRDIVETAIKQLQKATHLERKICMSKLKGKWL